ncbi:hypothetical protein HBI56_113190 [Parastagonospora nodorum]|nr:hypothetical protein HBH52_116900 [Parastagonospora nodorum]KAH4036409.1 hypothetical protein HBI09_072610 [Parastagonospora nodorum]KAH4067955.1 hypothetical protein HBH50_120750 [Parastagonospora nodorum]KAH4085810.1 hypothetical protein HBH48_154420 [Parastagonospora nodorum]KAH4102998.1 hypothetical protein HBH46_123040 [Parastagonospora nodorum]
MMSKASRVEVELKALPTCYLTNDPPFYFLVHIARHGVQDHTVFLQDGYADDNSYQPINSNRIFQCLDNETGEEVQILQQGAQPRLLDRSYIQFTTAENRRSYELPIMTSSLRPNRKYRLRFKSMKPISHWPASEEGKPNPREDAAYSAQPDKFVPPRSTISWVVPGGNETVIFSTLSSQPTPPKVAVTLSAPSTYSLSGTFVFELVFTTDARRPITVLADRAAVMKQVSDIEILDGKTRARLGPDKINICKDAQDPVREQFIRMSGSYTEQRVLDFEHPLWEDMNLEVGGEYIIRHLGDKRWWSEDTIDDILTYLDTKSNLGLVATKQIEFEGGREEKVNRNNLTILLGD